MIIDASVVVAILLKEPGFEKPLEALLAAEAVGIGAPSVVEATIVLSARLSRDCREIVDEFLKEVEAQILPFSDQHWKRAVEAYLRFGKGRHPAALNFGDCLTYATASLSFQPLLFCGQDFSQTDLNQAL